MIKIGSRLIPKGLIKHCRQALHQERVKPSTLERTPEVDVSTFNTKNVGNNNFFNRLVSKIFKPKEQPKSLLEQAKNIDNEYASRLNSYYETVNYGPKGDFERTQKCYTPDRIFEIVRASKKDPEFASKLENNLKKSILDEHTAASLYDLSTKEPKLFEVVKKFVNEKTAQGTEILRNLKHVPAEQVKYMTTKSVVKIENAASKNKQAVIDVLNEPLYKSIIKKSVSFHNENPAIFVELAIKEPKKTKKLVQNLGQKLNSKYANNKGIDNMHLDELNKIIKYYQAKPEQVDAIIEKFGFCRKDDIKVILEFEQKGKNIDKYVREYISNNKYDNKFSSNDMKKYIEFRLKTGSLYDNMIRGKDDTQIAKFYNEQFKLSENNNSALERMYRDGFKPNDQEQLDRFLYIYNKYPDTKITPDMMKYFLEHDELSNFVDLAGIYPKVHYNRY